MITVRMFFEVQDEFYGFRVDGHAQTAPYGEDLACAAVSALTQSAVMGLTTVGELDCMHHQQDGELICRLPDEMTKTQQIMARAILGTMICGLRAIAKQSTSAIRIHKRRCKKCSR